MPNFKFKHLLPEEFSPLSRVWIYQGNRLFSIQEALHIEDILKHFTDNWHSHGAKVKGHADLLFGQFIILLADETGSGVSGCSTDSSVRLIKELEKAFNVNLFDRQLLAFIVKDKIQLLPLPQLQYAIDNEFIDAESFYFNNLVQTKEEMEKSWILPVKESWLASRIKLPLQK